MADVNRLKSIQTAYKGHCTRNRTEANAIMDDGVADPDIEELESIYEGLSLRMEKIAKLDQEIFNAVDEGELANEVDLAAQYEENLVKFLKRVQSYLSKKKLLATDENNARIDVGLAPPPIPPIQQRELLEKLPSLGVKKFSGSPLKWLAFWDSFQAAIGKRVNMSDSTKMNYLLTYLEGDALSVVQNIPMTNENYATCVDLLKDRFGREDLIIDAYMDALNNMPRVAPADVSSLRRFYDTLESYVRALETLGVPSAGFGRFLTPMLMKKIPDEVLRVILRQTPEPTLQQLKTLLKTEVEVQERSARCAPPSKKTNSFKEDSLSSASMFVAHSESEKVACIFCSKNHKTENCRVVKNSTKRSNILKKQGRCFICLKKGHISKSCTQESGCPECGGKHHVLICRKKNSDGETQNVESKNDHDHNAMEKKSDDGLKTESKDLVVQCNATCDSEPASSRNCTLLQTVSTFAKCRRIRQKVRMLFDNAATRTFISKRLAGRLKCVIACKKVVNVGKFMDTETEQHEFPVVTLGLRLLSGKYFFLEAFVVDSIAAPIPMDVPKEFLEEPPFKDLKLADDFHDNVLRVDMIIGGDVYTKLVTGKSFKQGDILATESLFGWMVMGSTNPDKPTDNASCYTINAFENDDKPLDEILQKFWEVSACEEEVVTEDDAMAKFKETIRYDEEERRYCVSLPWKEPVVKHLPRQYAMCKSRLKSLVRRLVSMGLLENYDKILQDQLHKRFIELVPVAVRCTAVHYLPHFGVTQENSSTTKLRIVYDPSSSSSKFPCLNDLLHKGPSLIPHLATMLMRFRLPPIGVIADIEKAFLQILLAEEDRDFTRFLWLKDLNAAVVDSNIVEMRFRRVLFGPSPSPFLMNATVQHHLDTYDETDKIVQKLKSAFYSDNLVTGAETVEEGKALHQRTRDVFNEAGMNMRSWVTNDQCLQKYFDAAFSEVEKRVLGLGWNLKKDSLGVIVDRLLADLINLVVLTKRVACSLAPRLFDPLGFLEPFLIRAKIMMQELWRLKLGWDDVIPSPQLEEWLKWIQEIKNVPHYEVPRRYILCDPKEILKYQLHVFCDSSEKAYGAVCYLRVVTAHTVYIQHVFAKSRVAPIKKMTMPRLEFLAALLGCAVLKHVMSALDLPDLEVVCWSDSQIALYWIYGKGSPEAFVKNKLIKHRVDLSLGKWKYCPSKMNPADAITRGLSMKELIEGKWPYGPPWLYDENKWPDIPILMVQQPVKASVQLASVLVPTTGVSSVIDIEQFSTYTKLMAVTALVFRFAQNYCCTDREERKLGDVTVSELKNALLAWVIVAQSDCFRDEIVWLKGEKKKAPPPLVKQLKLFLDPKGILRCKGRIENALLPRDVKFPILLPKKHYLMKLIIWKCHKEVLHGLVRETLAQVRQRFWIPQGRRTVRNNIRGCVTCLKGEGQPFQGCEPPPLPSSRVSEGLAFQFCGVDFAGPVLVRQEPTMQPVADDGLDDPGVKKVYVALVTCAVTRALHLEIAEDLSTVAFLRVFRRFISRRGLPEKMISDNAWNFRNAADEITHHSYKILKSAECQRFFSNKGICWQFIVSRAAWWGGFYERMIGLMKRSLKKTIGKNLLWKEELSTIVAEVEAVLNSCPITYIYSDIDEGSPLAPAHFLCGKRLLDIPDNSDDDELDDPDFVADNQEKLLRHFETRSIRLKSFWNCWRKEYLINLREHDQVKQKKLNNTAMPKVGDIVLIGDKTPRSQWRLAKIVKLLSGADGVVRAADVKISNGHVLQRAIQHLYPLEVNDSSYLESNDTCSTDASAPSGALDGAANTAAPDIQLRPRRQAAIEATNRLRAMSM